MIIFADTSKDETRIALIEGGNFVEETIFESRGMQTELLLQNLELLLKKHRVDKRDIELFAIIEGPGSYTGLRIGLSTFNTLAFALNIPIIGLSSTLSDEQIISAVSKTCEVSFNSLVLPIYPHPPKITKSARP